MAAGNDTAGVVDELGRLLACMDERDDGAALGAMHDLSRLLQQHGFSFRHVVQDLKRVACCCRVVSVLQCK